MNTEKVYIAWPQEVVQETLQTFAEHMRGDDSSIKSLQEGIICLDFICRASELTDYQEDRWFGLETEANMRIDLMLEQQALQDTRSVKEKYEEQKVLLQQLHWRIKSFINTVPRYALSAEQVYFKHYGRNLIEDLEKYSLE